MKVITCLTLLLSTCLASANLLYLEDFSNTANGNNFNTAWNWGNADASLSSLVIDGVGVRHETWSQSDIAATPLNNNPVTGGIDMGTPYTPFNGATSRFMYTLEVASLGLTVADVGGFQADIRKNDAVNQVWFGIMSGTTWYFTQNTLNTIINDGYHRFLIPATNMVEINQVWDGGTGWGVDRNPIDPLKVVGPASLAPTDPIDGFSLLFTTQIGQLGNFYLDNVALSSVPEPSTCALLFGFLALCLVIRRRSRK
ncbi:MAG: PEP-CTERM sorting domain-containing protein [Oceanipulchritudo sp.]